MPWGVKPSPRQAAPGGAVLVGCLNLRRDLLIGQWRQVQGIESDQRFPETSTGGGAGLAGGEEFHKILDLRHALGRQRLKFVQNGLLVRVVHSGVPFFHFKN